MSYPVPVVTALAEFTGRDEDTFTVFADTALAQAALLFQFATGLTDPPTNVDEAQLADYAILELADRLYLEQPYALTQASPFQSETIGSYSYSKGGDLLARAKAGRSLGLRWWDLALAMLGKLEVTSSVASGSITAFDRTELHELDGQRYVFSPADLDSDRSGIGFYNGNTYRG